MYFFLTKSIKNVCGVIGCPTFFIPLVKYRTINTVPVRSINALITDINIFHMHNLCVDQHLNSEADRTQQYS